MNKSSRNNVFEDKTASEMTMTRNTLRTIIGAAAFTAMLTGSALAQFPTPSISIQNDKQKSPDEIEHDKAIDRAYQSATKKIPDRNAVNDPWADVRPTPPAAPPKKKQVLSQNKKQQESQAKKPGE